MNARQLQHQPVTRTFLHTADQNDYVPINMTAKSLSDDSCWDELDADYDESIPSVYSNFLDDDY